MNSQVKTPDNKNHKSIAPRRLTHWYVVSFAIVLFITSLFAVNAIAKTLPSNQSYLISLTNEDRAKNNLTPLQPNSQLEKAARSKAQDMFSNQYFDHISPTHKTPWSFILDSGYQYSYAGENLAIDFKDLKSTHTAWMNSPTHKANILDPHYREIGIASVNGTFQGRETIITVQMFGATPVDSLIDNLKNTW